MGKIVKRGTRGAVNNYINRSQAVKRLQIPLRDFRRLCILKGIYPREPSNKRKLQKGSTRNTTWYYRSDVMRLQHEPLLQQFREWKSFARKLARFVNKENWSCAESLENSRKPEIKLDHIIRERYPTFEDALRDLDDALSMVHLFATLAQPTGEFKPELLEACRQRVSEFEHYIVHTRCLRKSFVSVKGMYFQAVIQGVPVTWVIPHAFTQKIPRDVDFRVMFSFLQLYETLVGFVLFRLYKLAGMVYPSASGCCATSSCGNPSAQAVDDQDFVPDSSSSQVASTEKAANLVTYAQLAAQSATPALFSGMTFAFGRETNRGVLSMLVRAMGGSVVPDEPEGQVGITHQVIDRPLCPKNRDAKIVYMQPQWIFDCLNSGRLLLVCGIEHGRGYAPGDRLPPHLSPFADKSNPLEYDPTKELTETDENQKDSGLSKDPTIRQAQREREKMAKMMMARKDRFLYSSIVRTQKRKLCEIARLQARKRAITHAERKLAQHF